MDTSRYRAFINAVDLGTFTRAAQALDYTPSGVSQLVSALERDLGFEVLERTKKGVVPTSNGANILPLARAIVQEEDHLLQVSDEIKGLTTGTVTIGSYPSIATHWLPAVIKTFNERYPQIDIHIMEGIHQEIEDWLQNKEVDIGFLSYNDSLADGWISLADDPMVAVLPKGHPFASADSYPLAQLENEEFIMPGRGKDIDTRRALESVGVTPKTAYSTIENAACLAMVEQGMGVSVMNNLVTQKYNFDVSIIPIDPPYAIQLGIALPNKTHLAPAVARFVKHATSMLETRQ